ncbi:DUF5324 family protein [Kitasatospora sp. NPDC094015]|uniref:DUF5324 family protein n=1 Tax=Kitasatospora sp. NPDC094015 TaxID=3155205 RepID=UPI00332C6312
MNRSTAPHRATEKLREVLDTDLDRTRVAAVHGAEQAVHGAELAWHRIAPHLDALATGAGHAVDRARSGAVSASRTVPGRSAAVVAALRGRIDAAEIERVRKHRRRRRAGSLVALAALVAAGVTAWGWWREQSRYQELFEEPPQAPDGV